MDENTVYSHHPSDNCSPTPSSFTHSLTLKSYPAKTFTHPPTPFFTPCSSLTTNMTRFRPCIDLHSGQVKQIVGGTLDSKTTSLLTNFISPHPPSYFSKLYKENDLHGAHVIMLGPGNRTAAIESLAAWPNNLQIGGGINETNAQEWINLGASKVIITSYLFPNGTFSQERLDKVLVALGGDKEKLVIDLSCRRKGEDRWFVAMDKWQTITDMEVCEGESFFSIFSVLIRRKEQWQTDGEKNRIYQTARAVLLRVPHPRCRQRRPAAWH